MNTGYVVAVKCSNGNLEAQGVNGEDATELPLDAARSWIRHLMRHFGWSAVAIHLDTGVGCAGAPDLTYNGDLSERVTLA